MNSTLLPNATTASATAPITLDELFHRGDYYAVLRSTLPLLGHAAAAVEPQPPIDETTRVHAALLAVKSYVALGLIGPARELLASSASPLSVIPEFAPLLGQLQQMPSGRIPIEVLRRRLEVNAARLYTRHPHLREFDPFFRSALDQLEFYWGSDHNVHIRRIGNALLGGWTPALLPLRKLAAECTLPHNPKELFCQPYLVCGDHLGVLFRRVFDATSQMFMTFSPRLYLIEQDALLFAACILAHENIDAWCHERVSIFVGPDAVTRFEKYLLTHREQSPPGFFMRLPFIEHDSSETLTEAVRRVALAHGEQVRATHQRLTTYYATVRPNQWAERFARAVSQSPSLPYAARPLRILGLTSRFTTVLQYAMRDLQAAFAGLGHDFRVQMEPSDHDLTTNVDMVSYVEAFKPDLVFLIDHLRREYPHSIPPGVPFVCWIQDRLPHLMNVEAGRSHGPLDFYIAPACAELTEQYQYPRRQGMTWTMATNEKEYDVSPLPDSELADYRCDFSYVSNQSKLPELFHAEHRETYAHNASLVRVLDDLFDRISRAVREDPRTAPFRPASEWIEDSQRDLGLRATSAEILDRICRSYIHPLVELLFRQSTLEWVADYCDRTNRVLHIYGSGWEKHPRFARYHRGIAANGRSLRAIYQASRVNLQIIGSGAVHPRLLDGLAAGGFFFIRGCALDRIHKPCRSFVEIIQRIGLVADHNYLAEEIPDLSAVLPLVAPVLGSRAGAKMVRFRTAELELIESLASENAKGVAGAVFEDYEAIAFDTRADFERLAERFLTKDSERAEIADRMRRAVLDRFTYTALAKDLLAFLSDRLTNAADKPAAVQV